MRILHYSDSHLAPRLRGVPWRDWPSKRLTGAFNYLVRRRRAFRFAASKLGRLTRFAAEQEVDLVLFTGDHTLLGTLAELTVAREAIEPFLGVRFGYVTLPGNHDLYTPDTVREGRFEARFGDFLWSDLPDRAVDGPFPLVRLPGEEVAVVAVNSSRPHRSPWLANGRVADLQIAALRSLLEDPRIRSRFVFVMTHHAPFLAGGVPDHPSHGLENAAELLDACSGMACGALLFGHVHHRYHLRLPGHPTSFFGAGSATLEGREGAWLFDVDGEAVRARGVVWSAGEYRLEEGSTLEL